MLGPVADCEGGANGPLGIVAVRHRGAEHAHHGVADELLDPAAMTLELAADSLVVRHEKRSHVLGVELLGARGEPHEIDEEDGYEPPLFARPARRREGGAARVAELRAGGVLLATT